MERNIKLIWDFRGPDASRTAEHFSIHLAEARAGQEPRKMAVEHVSDVHSLVYMVVPESEMRTERDRFKPHRGELATP